MKQTEGIIIEDNKPEGYVKPQRGKTTQEQILDKLEEILQALKKMTTEITTPPPVNQSRWLVPVQNAVSVNSTLTPTNSRIYLVLLQIQEACTVDGVLWTNGAANAGNVRVGIYRQVTEDTATGATLLVESADTAVTANFDQQLVALTATALSPGLYYVAIAFSNITVRPYRNSTVTLFPTAGSIYDQAYGALPATMPAITHGYGLSDARKVRPMSTCPDCGQLECDECGGCLCTSCICEEDDEY